AVGRAVVGDGEGVVRRVAHLAQRGARLDHVQRRLEQVGGGLGRVVVGVGEAVHGGVHVDRVDERVAGAGRHHELPVVAVCAAVVDLHVLQVDAQHRVGDVDLPVWGVGRAVVGDGDVVVGRVAHLRQGGAGLGHVDGRLEQVGGRLRRVVVGVGEAVH